jgi:hypothetical protein
MCELDENYDWAVSTFTKIHTLFFTKWVDVLNKRFTHNRFAFKWSCYTLLYFKCLLAITQMLEQVFNNIPQYYGSDCLRGEDKGRLKAIEVRNDVYIFWFGLSYNV